MLYSHMQIHIYIYTCIYIQYDSQRHRTSKDFFNKIYTSQFICNLCVWEVAGDRTELQYIDPDFMAVSVVSFSFSRLSKPEAQGPTLLTFSTASYHQRVSETTGDPEGPFISGVAFPTTSYQQLLWTPTHQGPREPLWPGVVFPSTFHL